MTWEEYLPGARRKPLYLEDFLVECWRFQSVGRDDDARRLLLGVWSWAMDEAADEEHVRVALRLLDRLGFTTDDPAAWSSVPDEIVIYRAESRADGFCWTLDREVAEMHASRYGLAVVRGTTRKADVLAYITHYGEEEIVVRRNRVRG